MFNFVPEVVIFGAYAYNDALTKQPGSKSNVSKTPVGEFKGNPVSGN